MQDAVQPDGSEDRAARRVVAAVAEYEQAGTCGTLHGCRAGRTAVGVHDDVDRAEGGIGGDGLVDLGLCCGARRVPQTGPRIRVFRPWSSRAVPLIIGS